MSTSDLSGTPGAGTGPDAATPAPPISEEALSAIASQLYATPGGAGGSAPTPGPDRPAALAPVAPRGGGWDGTAATSAAHTASGLGATLSPSALPFGDRSPVPNLPFAGHHADPAVGPQTPGPDTPPELVTAAPRPGWVGAAGPALRALDPGLVPDLYGAGGQPGPTAAAASSTDAAQFYFLRDRDASPAVAPSVQVSRPEFDVTSLRRDFPILAERVNGHQLVWLDNAATTQKPRAVIERLTRFYEHENSNIHRAAHELAARATDAYEDARGTVRRFIGAARDEEIVFVRGTTEGINLVAHSWGRHNLREGDEIVITHLEHHANIVPWQMIARRTGAVLKVAPVDDRGNLLMEEFADLVGPRTKLVAATHVSNALGTVTPVEQIVEIGHRAGARVLIDGAQSVPHLAVDLQRLGADFFVFSGHKIFGPTGIGVVYVSERVWDETPAWQGGGNMIEDVTLERSVYQSPPNKYEAGTGNIADAVGLGEALRYVNRVGIERMAQWEHRLLAYATPRLADVPGVRLVGTADDKASVLSFVLAGHDPVAVGRALNEVGIAVRAGHHCAQPILRRLGLEATVRPSFAFYNTLEEADRLVNAVRDIATSSHRI